MFVKTKCNMRCKDYNDHVGDNGIEFDYDKVYINNHSKHNTLTHVV